jgi:hypothetical protein
MHLLEQLINCAQTYPLFPSLVFVAMVVGLYLLLRPKEAPEPLVTVTTAPEAPTAPPPPAKPKEQRAITRRHGNPVEVYVAPPEDKKNPGIGSLLDRSMGGMRLALFHEVDIGTILAVHPIRADEMVPWVELEVRSCKPSTEMPGQFEVGCQYVKSPPYSIQLLFG